MDSFISFLKYPQYQKSTRIDWAHFFKVLLFFLFINLVYAPVPAFLRGIFHVKEENLSISPILLLAGMVIIAPIFEEIIFRLFLKPTTINLKILFLFASSVAFLFIFKHNRILTCCFATVASMLIYVCSSQKRIIKFQHFVLDNFRALFYISTGLFGLIHILNVEEITTKLVLVAFFIFLPQIIAGGFLGYIRIKYGIIYSIFFHALINLFPAVLKLLIS